jgi:hypothetical protein
VFRDQLTAEWIKLRSLRSTSLMLLTATTATLALGYLRASALASRWSATAPDVRASYDPVATSLAGVALAIVILGALGTLAITSEYATGLIRTTLTATPARLRVLAAKTAITGAIALLAGEAMSFAAYALGQALYGPHHIGPALTDPSAVRAVACSGLVLTSVALLGLGLGTLTRNTAGAITALATLTVVIPGVLAGLPAPWNRDIGRFSFLSAANQLVKTHPDPNLLSPALSGAVIAAYTIAVLAAAAFALTHRDA